MQKQTLKMIEQALLALTHVAEDELPSAAKYLIGKLEEKYAPKKVKK